MIAPLLSQCFVEIGSPQKVMKITICKENKSKGHLLGDVVGITLIAVTFQDSFLVSNID